MLLTKEKVRRFSMKVQCMINLAYNLKPLSTDPRIQVGCVIFPLDCSHVLSNGYNGAPRDFSHLSPCESLDTPGGSGFCHAELNALTKLNTMSAPPSLLFVTTTPCKRCAGQIINAGPIIGVIHGNVYEGDKGAGLDYLKKSKRIQCLHQSWIESSAETGVCDSMGILKSWIERRYA